MNIDKYTSVENGNNQTAIFDNTENRAVCFIPKRHPDSEINTGIIINALNTAAECGLSPAELLQQNKELREALAYAIRFVDEQRADINYLQETLSKHPNK